MNTQLSFANIHILGPTLVDKLSWRPHLKKPKAECLTRMKTIKIFKNNNWGFDTKILPQSTKILYFQQLIMEI